VGEGRGGQDARSRGDERDWVIFLDHFHRHRDTDAAVDDEAIGIIQFGAARLGIYGSGALYLRVNTCKYGPYLRLRYLRVNMTLT